MPALDPAPNTPATLSQPMCRASCGDFGFNGLIYTDSMGMAGVTQLYTRRAAVRAFKAGNDIVLTRRTMGRRSRD